LYPDVLVLGKKDLFYRQLLVKQENRQLAKDGYLTIFGRTCIFPKKRRNYK